MVRLGEIDNFKCDGLAMVASGKGNVKVAFSIKWEGQCQMRIARSGGKVNVK